MLGRLAAGKAMVSPSQLRPAVSHTTWTASLDSGLSAGFSVIGSPSADVRKVLPRRKACEYTHPTALDRAACRFLHIPRVSPVSCFPPEACAHPVVVLADGVIDRDRSTLDGHPHVLHGSS